MNGSLKIGKLITDAINKNLNENKTSILIMRFVINPASWFWTYKGQNKAFIEQFEKYFTS